jgi:hypothetical protein
MSAVFFWLTKAMIGDANIPLLRISSIRCLHVPRMNESYSQALDGVHLLFLLVASDELDALVDRIDRSPSLTDRDCRRSF